MKAIAALIKEQAGAQPCQNPVDFADVAPRTQPESILIDKDSAVERFSHMLIQADMLFHMMQSHSISLALRGIEYDACTL